MIFRRFNYNLKQSDKKSNQLGILGPGRPFNGLNAKSNFHSKYVHILMFAFSWTLELFVFEKPECCYHVIWRYSSTAKLKLGQFKCLLTYFLIQIRFRVVFTHERVELYFRVFRVCVGGILRGWITYCEIEVTNPDRKLLGPVIKPSVIFFPWIVASRRLWSGIQINKIYTK